MSPERDLVMVLGVFGGDLLAVEAGREGRSW